MVDADCRIVTLFWQLTAELGQKDRSARKIVIAVENVDSQVAIRYASTYLGTDKYVAWDSIQSGTKTRRRIRAELELMRASGLWTFLLDRCGEALAL